jgi:hypothetical protein
MPVTNSSSAKAMYFVISFLSLWSHAHAAALVIDYSNNNSPGFELLDNSGVPLSPGLEFVEHDGAVLEVGYFSLATTENPFAGAWVTMAGPSIPSATYATIEDMAYGLPGHFNRSAGFGETPAGPYGFPVVGTPMSIRFFNSPASVRPSHFNAVSSINWVWTGQADPFTELDMDLTASPLLWLGGADSAFRTTLPVPEISTWALLISGSASLLMRRRVPHQKST